MNDTKLTIAMITEVFFDDDGPSRLRARLDEARTLGAGLAVLPELPLNPWSPATKVARDEDAEAPGGPRHQTMAAAAKHAGIALLGGVIERDPASGRRFNRALLFAADGKVIAGYCKTHLPQEEGFWEASHYDPGDDPPHVIHGLSLRLGVQICSDANRPQLTHLLAAKGAEAIFVPRATPSTSYDRWKLVLTANAVMSATYVISLNRPGPEAGVPIGGPSVAIAPNGEVLLETTDNLALVTLERSAVEAAREDYPGYLAQRHDLYEKSYRSWRNS